DRPRARSQEAAIDRADGAAPHVPHRSVRPDRSAAEEQGRLAGVSAGPVHDHGRMGHEGVPAERQEATRAEGRMGVHEGKLTRATRMFGGDRGAGSVKLAIASPGLRGAMLQTVVERMVPPGDEPAEQRTKQALAALIEELRLRDETGYIGVYGDQVFTQVLEF